jgi:pimeloyl-ACP methyl ester carboxylesterase
MTNAKATASPKTDRTIELRDGRALAFCEWGDLQGKPVVLFHGMPGSRLFCPDEDATEAAGVRLITVDRPGYGRSDPRPGRTLLDWVDDYVELAESLALPASPIIGWSGGGPYALACAAGIPDRVPTIGLAASPGPVAEVPGAFDELSPDDQMVAELWDRDRVAAIEEIERQCQPYADDPDVILGGYARAHPDDLDTQLLVGSGALEPMQQMMREGARQRSAGWASDWIAEYLSPWGFSLTDILQDVHVWWGDADRLVARANTDYLATTIPRSKLVIYPGEGHSVPVSHWSEMLSALSA